MPLGFAAGLPLFLSRNTLTAWLYVSGVSIEAVGLFALVSLPYNFKFAWAPVLDRFRLPWLTRRRGWILAAQLGLVAAIGVMGTLDAATMTAQLALMAIVVASLSASQDIVVDAYRSDVLGDNERGRGSAAYVAGYRVALIVTGSGALMISPYVGFGVAYWLVAALMLGGILATLKAPPAPRAKPPESMARAIVDPLRELFRRRSALLALAIVLTYKLGDTVAEHMITAFLLDSGYSELDIGLWKQAMGMGATIVGAVVGGVMIDRIGVTRGLLLFGLLQALANLGYMAIALAGKSHALLIVAIGVDNLCNGLGTAALMAFLLALCNKRFSATQYALLTSASSILGRSMGAGAGYVATAVGWTGFFAISMAAAVPALLMIALVREDSIFPEPDGPSEELDQASR